MMAQITLDISDKEALELLIAEYDRCISAEARMWVNGLTSNTSAKRVSNLETKRTALFEQLEAIAGAEKL